MSQHHRGGLVGSYPAKGSDGNDYHVVVWQERAEDGQGGANAGVILCRTSEEEVLDRLDKGVYQISGTGIILRSESPDAP